MNSAFRSLDTGNASEAVLYFASALRLAPGDPAGVDGMKRSLRTLSESGGIDNVSMGADEALRVLGVGDGDVTDVCPSNRSIVATIAGMAATSVGCREDEQRYVDVAKRVDPTFDLPNDCSTIVDTRSTIADFQGTWNAASDYLGDSIDGGLVASAADLCNVHERCEASLPEVDVIAGPEFKETLILATDADQVMTFAKDVFLIPWFCQGIRVQAVRRQHLLYVHATAWNEGRVFDDHNWHCDGGQQDAVAFDLVYNLMQGRRVLRVVSRKGRGCEAPLNVSIRFDSASIAYSVRVAGSARVCEGSLD